MYDEISHRMFSGPELKYYIEFLETLVAMYIEVAIAIVLLMLIALILLSISGGKRSQPGKTIADHSRAQKSDNISLSATGYEYISLSQSSTS